MLDKLYDEVDLCRSVWNEKYLAENEKKPSDAMARISSIMPEIYFAMIQGKFLPGGRIIKGLGIDSNLTLMNCYVEGIQDDSLKAIFNTANNLAQIFRTGGGAGINISGLRPKGSKVNNAAKESSGAVSFMEVYDKVTGVVSQQGRRGALMINMEIAHPDIEEFITIKNDTAKTNLTNCNISVLIRDEFMLAVQEDYDWPLWYPVKLNRKITASDFFTSIKNIEDCYSSKVDLFYIESLAEYRERKVFKTVKARELWNLIVKNAYDSAEPGLLFMDTIKEDHTLEEITPITGTNPCVTGDTLIYTNKGYKQIKDTVDKEITVWNGFTWATVIPKITGYNKQLLEVELNDGRKLKCTLNHKFILKNNKRVEAKDLKVNDKLAKFTFPIIQGEKELAHPYNQGLFSGDGYLRKERPNKAFISLFKGKKHLVDFRDGYMTEQYNTEKEDRYEIEVDKLDKSFVPLNNYTIETRLKWLAGLADTDGTRNDSGGSLSISSINKQFLLDIQMLLSTLGVNSTVVIMKKAQKKLMPNGKGGKSYYDCKECYRIIISAYSNSKLQEEGFSTNRVNISTSVNRDASRFKYIKSITQIDEIEKVVYCFTEPLNHTGVFNGIYTGQCGEQPLPDKGSCNLGSINLSKYINDPFTSYATFDDNEFVKDVQLAIEYLDKIVDQNTGRNAIKEQDELLQRQRRLGLGIMGLADAFAMLGMKYDSVSAKRFANEVFDLMETAAYIKSFELAKELGPFPEFSPCLVEHGHLRKVIEKGILDEEEVKEHGIRNATLLSIAPTGTLHILAQCSSGIEPIFELEYTRNSESLKTSKFNVYHRAYQQYKEITEKTDKPGFFQTAYEVNPEARVILQGQIQKYIDTAISVTVNFPKNAKIDEISEVYIKAWENDCKGMTVYREGSRSQVLVAGEVESDVRDRYEVLEGKTIVIPSNPKIYLTANYNPVNNKIVEVFINSSKSGSDVKATSEGFGRLISLFLQKGGEVKDVVNTLLDIKGEETLFTKLGSFHSFPDTIAKALQNLAGIVVVNKCPNCGSEIRMESGCMICMNCGYSKC